MFSKNLVELQNTVIKENILSKAVQELYNPEISYYYNEKSNTKNDFNKAKSQLDTLLKSIDEKTGKKYNLFQDYRKKIATLDFNKSKVDNMSALDFAKKTLEYFYDDIIANHAKVDSSLINNLEVTK